VTSLPTLHLRSMKCDRAIIHYVEGKPADYSLIIAGLASPQRQLGGTHKEVPFTDAYKLFPSIQKHWNPDGTAKN
jgi:hypothetical protein